MNEIKCKVSSGRGKISGLGKMLKNDPGALFFFFLMLLLAHVTNVVCGEKNERRKENS